MLTNSNKYHITLIPLIAINVTFDNIKTKQYLYMYFITDRQKTHFRPILHNDEIYTCFKKTN